MAGPRIPAVGARLRAWRGSLNGGVILMALLIGVMGFYVIYPLVLILINSFNTATIAEPPVYGLQAWRDAFSEPGIWRSLWNSVRVGVTLQIVALPIGIWISCIMPSVATTFGWMLLLDPNTGLVNTTIRGWPIVGNFTFDIYSFWGIIWAHLVSNGISTKVMLMTPAFRRMDSSLEEASRMSGAST